MKTPFRIFYAWQSDHASNACKLLIREALDEAAARINGDSSVSAEVAIDQDTQGVPGLCDIPATILAKIDECDAFVGDLTYIALSPSGKNGKPRQCSNPNVLFELGYAFHAIGSNRLILTMNEAHGPATEQIFDLNHRRHPIAYRYPSTSRQSRKQIVLSLSKDLEAAIRATLTLGPRSTAGPNLDGEIASDLNQAKGTLAKLLVSEQTQYLWSAAFYCSNYRHEIWSNNVELESAVSSRAIWDHARSHKFPSQQVGTKRFAWGIANDTYGEAWMITRTGMCLFKRSLALMRGEFPPPTQYRLDGTTFRIGEGKWMSLNWWRIPVFDWFRFCRSWSNEFPTQSKVTMEISANVKGLHLIVENTPSARFVEKIESAEEHEFRFTRTLRADEFQQQWNVVCAEATDALIYVFPSAMGYDLPSSREWVDEQAKLAR